MALLLFVSPRAVALNPELDVSQYAHTAWRYSEGRLTSPINAMAQTPDGYLWLGTDSGLLRFDGVRVTPWELPDQPLPSKWIASLLTARDGTLWIGTVKGLASWKNGKLTSYPQLSGGMVLRLLEDREGTIWASSMAAPPPGKLCSIRGDAIECASGEEAHGYGASLLYEDSKGTLWVGVHDGLWRWKPGPHEFYPLPGNANGIVAASEDDDGALLVGWQGGISRFDHGNAEPLSLDGVTGPFTARNILRDRDGGLWFGTLEQGLLHIHRGRVDRFVRADGLLSNDIYKLFEDREGNVWVATPTGLDRFRDYAVPTFSTEQGLSNGVVGSVLSDRNGNVWLATFDGLDRWTHGRVTPFGKHDGKLNGRPPNSLFQDTLGRIWASTREEFGYLKDDEYVVQKDIPGGWVTGIAEDAAGNLWIANQQAGLIERTPSGAARQFRWPALGHEDHATALSADPADGGLWLGFYNGGVTHWIDDQVSVSYTEADGLGKERVMYLRPDGRGALWITTAGGLSRLKNKRIATITRSAGLPCDSIHWMAEGEGDSIWLLSACGLLHISRARLDEWMDDIESGKLTARPPEIRILDNTDGVQLRAESATFAPHFTFAADGNLWFVRFDGVSVLDPKTLSTNKLPPPVSIEQIIADRKVYEDAASSTLRQAQLPPLVRDIEIDYTALSLVAAEKNQFRYKLEGRDRDWQDVGNRRRAFYNDLPPGDYRFRVVASNNSGMWNEEGAALDFSIAPAYWQTNWFRALCAALIVGALWAIYRMRVRALAQRYREKLDERVGERTRIARELHDTLLQSFQGAVLLFQTVYEMLPAQPNQAKVRLANAIDLSATAIGEARDTVQGLRSSAAESNDLARAIQAVGEELAGEQAANERAEFQVGVLGSARPLHPIVRDEIQRIAGEALRNAFKHAQATSIDVELSYGERVIRLRVRDDGRGIDNKFLDGDGPAGHYGLHGMRERARLIGGSLTIWSGPKSGTEVEFTLAASHAYEAGLRHRWFRRRPRRTDRLPPAAEP